MLVSLVLDHNFDLTFLTHCVSLCNNLLFQKLVKTFNLGLYSKKQNVQFYICLKIHLLDVCDSSLILLLISNFHSNLFHWSDYTLITHFRVCYPFRVDGIVLLLNGLPATFLALIISTSIMKESLPGIFIWKDHQIYTWTRFMNMEVWVPRLWMLENLASRV